MQIKNYLACLFFAGSTYNMYAQDTTKTKPEFKPSGKLWGYVFGDYYYKLHADSLNRGAGEYSAMNENSNAFEFRRVYLGYDYNISEKFSAELLLSHEKNYDASANRTVFIKAANVRWKNILPKNDLIIGQSSTPTWSFVSEKMWGYRSVEKTVTDMHKAGSSNDIGIALQGKLDSAGNFGYNLMLGNGTGSKIENDVFKKMYGEVYVKLFKQKLILDFYADFERKQLKPYRKDYSTYKIFLAYQAKRFIIGAEAYYQFQDYIPYDENTDKEIIGTSLFAKAVIIKDKLNFFVRNDMYIPDMIMLSTGYKSSETFQTAGLDYTPNKNIHIIPNIWNSSYYTENPALPVKIRRDNDLVVRITIYYIFK